MPVFNHLVRLADCTIPVAQEPEVENGLCIQWLAGIFRHDGESMKRKKNVFFRGAGKTGCKMLILKG